MGREIPRTAVNTSRSGQFSGGRGIAAPGTDTDAGGANLAKPLPTQDGGSALNKGRLNGGTDVHHNGGTHSIGPGSTEPSR